MGTSKNPPARTNHRQASRANGPVPSRKPTFNHDKLSIAVAWRPRTSWRAIALLERCARRAASAEGFDRGSLSIAVVGAAAMTTLHRLHLGREEPTDVLTFDLGTDCRHGILDGEIVLCADMARRRAAARDKTLATARAELALYLVHGLLHLAGYNDRDAAAFRRMHRREDEILETLGLGGVFQDGA